VDDMGQPLGLPLIIGRSVDCAAADKDAAISADQLYSHACDSLGGFGPVGAVVKNCTHPTCIKSQTITSSQ
jgi:hypothetical protein